MSKFTRRELAAGAVHIGGSCWLGPKLNRPLPPLPANAEEELKAARAQLRDNAGQLDKFPLPMDAEPATTFKP